MSNWLERVAKSLRRRSEERRFRRFRPAAHHHFAVVSCGYGTGEFVERHLASVHDQDYPTDAFTHLWIDDASPDDSVERARAWHARRPEARLEIMANEERHGGCFNYTRGFRRAAAHSIVLQVDGDDWLPDTQVLQFLNMIYHDAEVWMTYNSWISAAGEPATNCKKAAKSTVERNLFRDSEWDYSHLHTFRRPLFDHVRAESLIDPATAEPWAVAVDQAQFLPMLELAGHHARHIERICYVYNFGTHSIEHGSRSVEQAAAASRIRTLDRYEPLERLAVSHSDLHDPERGLRAAGDGISG